MTSISLREYHNDIEKMIEGGQVNEAIAHCQNILRSYPMNLDTYRYLGKAYLESRKYKEAANIFQRILSSVPDDFVSNVGMSIIRDNEKKLVDSIWYMERAFEVQPSNSAIQEELRKLYGRRDGVEPTKVRLTRDALANMYTQGALYSQAIAEIRSVLAEDPNRPDLKVMLAKAYSKDGRKKQSIEICTELLKEYPYCFDALRLMVDLLSSVENQKLISAYRARINALDPYAEFVTGSIFESENVADDLVKVDYLNAVSDASKENSVTSESRQNEKGIGERAKTQITAESQQPVRKDEIDTERESSLEDLLNNLQTENLQSGEGGIVKTPEYSPSKDEVPDEILPNTRSEIPDWIKDLAPDGQDQNSDEKIIAEDEGQRSGMSKGLGEEYPSSESITTNQLEEDSSEEIPGWLKDLGTDELFKTDERETSFIDSESSDDKVFSSTDQNVPEWLQDAQTDIHSEQPIFDTGENDLPDWLKGFETEKALDNLLHVDGFDPGSQEKNQISQEGMSIQPELGETPDSFLEEEINVDFVEESYIETREINELTDESGLDRLVESIETKHENEIPEIIKEQSEQPEVSSIDQDLKPEDQLGDLSDADAAFAWLESLAARQGADPNELSTKSDSMDTEPPDWIKKAIGESSESVKETDSRDFDQNDSLFDKELISEIAPTIEEEDPDNTQEMIEQVHESTIKEPEISDPYEDDILSFERFDNQEEDEEDISLSAKELDHRSVGDEWIPSIESEEDLKFEEKEQEIVPSLFEGVAESTEANNEEDNEQIVQPALSDDWKPIEETDLDLEREEIQIQQPEFIASNEELSQLNKVPASGVKTRKPVKDYEIEEEILQVAQRFIEHRDLKGALDEYRKLIKKGKLLEGVIHDLKEVSYQYPVDVSVWQSLGDAFMRANQLQDALDSYTKAEELLR